MLTTLRETLLLGELGIIHSFGEIDLQRVL